MPQLQVNLPACSYPIMIDRGLLGRSGDIIRRVVGANTMAVAVDAAVASNHGDAVERSLREAGCTCIRIELHASEAGKSPATVQHIHERLLEHRIERSGAVVAVGGGIVGDVAGFAAATWMRGVPLVHVPTTLLAMVDAAVGGKTGVNLPLPSGGLAKNMVGAFWQPAAVLADVETLATLDAREFRCGLAECVKHGILADPDLLSFIERRRTEILRLDMDVLVMLVARSAAVKIGFVQQDEREAGRRALLNLGHTFGHALESVPELDLRHGEAVSLGMAAACECSLRTNRMSASDAARIRSLLESVGLPVRLAKPVAASRLIDAMRHDKKVSQGRMWLVLPTAIGEAVVTDDTPEAVIRRSLESIGAAA